ncbi:MAG: hypothetical protein C6Y22_30655 [Hapalosiphonaceae cyanobacterium JJU2]|nr:MAG: hypothetical protein C6Y22_30655 [Hapalosiphonaceae cyanobacterium JJU2]
MINHKLLHSNGHTITLINCKLHPEYLTCGAAYFVAGLPEYMFLYSLNGDKICSIVVPENIRNNPIYTRLLSLLDDIKLDLITNYEL